eukprot:CAMPEP_0197894828 /NCGR_PEP_ID=MMETSP1439-20131203/36039_1 /TAXON_ID=66791 /ORGANISM="Gonyaulax spinifera, Strain CCMP409" /LENGTH=61 /DNA_ID=CAMNT_0043515215 /DNA_START=53 /DNA_END=236 /DNA_ORIENTATION=-
MRHMQGPDLRRLKRRMGRSDISPVIGKTLPFSGFAGTEQEFMLVVQLEWPRPVQLTQGGAD